MISKSRLFWGLEVQTENINNNIDISFKTSLKKNDVTYAYCII